MWFFKSSVPIADSGILHGMTDCHSHLLPGVDDGVKNQKKENMGEFFRLRWETARSAESMAYPHIMEDMPMKPLHYTKFLR